MPPLLHYFVSNKSLHSIMITRYADQAILAAYFRYKVMSLLKEAQRSLLELYFP